MKKLFRTSFWLQSILPIVIGNTLLWTLILRLPLSINLVIKLSLFSVSAIGFFSLGYLINDFFDQSEDKEAGKSNIFASINPFLKTTLFLFAASLALFPWFGLKINGIILFLLISQISLFFLYNSPPFRLKNIPFLSNIVDASYAYLIPFVLIYFLLASNQFIEGNQLFFLIIGAILYFIVGFRNILIHQIDDLESDAKLKKHTTALYLGFENSAKLLFFLATIEMFLLLTFILFLFNFSNLYIVLIPIMLLINLNAAYVYNKQSKNFQSLSQFGLLNNNIFQYYIPLLSSIILALSNSYYWLILLGFQILFLSPKNFFLELLTPNKVLNDLWHKAIKNFCFNTLKPILGKITNYIIYYLFKLFGVDLIIENRSALSFLKDKFKKNNPKDR